MLGNGINKKLMSRAKASNLKKWISYTERTTSLLYFPVLRNYFAKYPATRNEVFQSYLCPLRAVKIWAGTGRAMTSELSSILAPHKLPNQFLFLPSSFPASLCTGPSCAVPIWVTQRRGSADDSRCVHF